MTAGGQPIKRLATLLALMLTTILAQPTMAQSPDQGRSGVTLASPRVALANVPVTLAVSGAQPGEMLFLQGVQGPPLTAPADCDGRAAFASAVFAAAGAMPVRVLDSAGNTLTEQSLRVLPGWVSVLPPLVAIAFALIWRNVIPALFVSIWLGATLLNSLSPQGAFAGLLESFQSHVVAAVSDEDHATVILFSLMIGGMVGIVTRVGGMAAIVTLVVSRARTAVGGQISIWLMGLVIFFDDYSNTLVVGNTARPISDHLKISREKLAYIVDSTAAPVVCLALITTWIGYEVALIGDAVALLDGFDQSAYTVFLHSIPYSFYPVLAVIFVLSVAATGRDFGPMYHAEVVARGGAQATNAATRPEAHADNLDAKDGVPARAVNALIPIGVLIVGLIAGLFATGEGDTLSDIVGSADSYKALMWASLLGVLAAGGLAVGQRILSVDETVDAWYRGLRAMLFAMIVLVLAWALSGITEALHTAAYLVSVLGDTLPMEWVPAIVFALSAVTAFSTGTSWGALGILMPLVIPLVWAVMMLNGATDPSHYHILYSTIACVLAGSVWGDHCSPISDTTVLSSMASGCDHIAHVRTQLPYALVVGAVALCIGTVPVAYGMPWWLSMLSGIALLLLILRLFGRRADA